MSVAISNAVQKLQSYLPKSEPLRSLSTSVVIGAGLLVATKIGFAIKSAISSSRRAAAAKKRASEQKKDVVYLFAFPKSKAGVQFSTPCERVELYLELNKIPYETIETMDTTISDSERLPCIELNGKQYFESKFILEALEAAFNKTEPVAASSEKERENQSVVAALLALTEAIRWHHYRHVMIESPEVSIKLYTEALGYPEFMIRKFVMSSRKGMIKTWNEAGHGDLTVAQFNQNFLEDIKSLEYFVGKHSGKFLLGGETPTKIDCLVAPWIRTYRRQLELVPTVPAYAFACSSQVFADYLALIDAAKKKKQ
jgi:glutathione S-transferase